MSDFTFNVPSPNSSTSDSSTSPTSPSTDAHCSPSSSCTSAHSRPSTSASAGSSARKGRRAALVHPYARLAAKQERSSRKIWNHALEKHLFSTYELGTLGAPHRRTIYIASLEAHVERLHAQLLRRATPSELDVFRGLNGKVAKSMIAGLQHDAVMEKMKVMELERAVSTAFLIPVEAFLNVGRTRASAKFLRPLQKVQIALPRATEPLTASPVPCAATYLYAAKATLFCSPLASSRPTLVIS
ncbi:hypothetical protein HDZ31DRAFT_48624 [Schizophyllum fasciatum]